MRRLLAGIHRHEIEGATRVAVAVGLPLLALYAMGRLDLAVYAAFGGLAMLYGHNEPAKRRVETQIVAGTGLVVTIAVAMAYSAAQAPVPVLGVLLAGTVIAAATLGAAMRWVPRGEMFFVLVLLIVADIPTSWDHLPLAVAVSAGGATLSVLLAVLISANRNEPADEPKPSGWRRRVAAGYATLDHGQHLVLVMAATLACWRRGCSPLSSASAIPSGQRSPSPR